MPEGRHRIGTTTLHESLNFQKPLTQEREVKTGAIKTQRILGFNFFEDL
jgi:hypothetical protein